MVVVIDNWFLWLCVFSFLLVMLDHFGSFCLVIGSARWYGHMDSGSYIFTKKEHERTMGILAYFLSHDW